MLPALPRFHPKTRFESVDLGGRTVSLPFAEIVGARPGKTLLVTGGMDGDEYAGIEAAARLIERSAERDFAGRLLVAPLVNLPGFEAGVSWNPMDHRLPKHIFPGRRNGSPTERLVSWVAEKAQRADVWLDLHGGAHDEDLQPFVLAYKTGRRGVDALTLEMEESTEAEIVVREPARWFTKPWRLSRKGCAYLIFESGRLGERREEDIERHLTWTEACMETLQSPGRLTKTDEIFSGTGPRRPVRKNLSVSRLGAHSSQLIGGANTPRGIGGVPVPRLLRAVTEIPAPFDGVWELAKPLPKFLWKNHLIGTCTSESHIVELKAPSNGVPLWWKSGQREVKRGETLCAIGR